MCSDFKEYYRHVFLSFWIMQLFIYTSLSSCTVKEDREMCPCELSLHVEGVVTSPLQLFFEGEEAFFSDSVMLKGTVDHSLIVPRMNWQMLAVSADSGALYDKGKLVIPIGEDCPSVYQCSRSLDTRCEHLTDTFRLHKNFCEMEIEVVAVELEEDWQMEMNLVGKVAGYDRQGLPVSGDFRYALQPDLNGKCRVSIPRQRDASLQLEMGREGKVFQSYAVGEFMEEAGYDWTTPDLKDCKMTIDVSLMMIFLKIGDWKEGYSFKITI